MVAALQLSLLTSVSVVTINAVAGTVIAWVLTRDAFRGKAVVYALIDLPFALPTIVTGLTLLTLYGPRSPFGVNVAYTRFGIILSLLSVTLPFAVRAFQPVLAEIDREMEDAATSLGASELVTFQYIILPSLLPAILSGAALGFTRSIGEFGAAVLISGNIPFQTEVATVNIFGLIESGLVAGGAAVSVVRLGVSLGMLLVIGGLQRWGEKYDR